MEKKNKIISLTSIGVGASIFVIFLVLFILSYSVDSGDWGMDISASKDYLVVLVSGIILVLLIFEIFFIDYIPFPFYLFVEFYIYQFFSFLLQLYIILFEK